MPFVKQTTAAELLEAAKLQEVHQLQGIRAQNAEPRGLPKSDIVLVFPFKVHPNVKWGENVVDEGNRGLRPPTDTERIQMEKWQAKRSAVLHALNDAGLVLMLYYSRDRSQIFCRVAADQAHLRQVAEVRKYKLELKPQYLSAFAEYKKDYAGRRELNYSDRCIVSHIYKSHVDKSEEEEAGVPLYPLPGAIFKTTDRINLIDHIIRASDHGCAAVDVGQLMHDNDLLHYFPLHEQKKLCFLDREWFRAFAWGGKIDEVRDYFGEKVAMYFLFMSHFMKWLIAPTIIGVALSIVSVIAGTPDNMMSIFLCVCVGIWATLFVHFWRRSAAIYALKWGTLGMGRQTEPSRPEFRGASRINPVTGRIDRYYPWSERIWKVMFSYTVLTVSVVVLIFSVLVLMAIRHTSNFKNKRLLYQVLTAILVELFNSIFTHIAKWLTDRENHRSYSEYTNHLLAKTVVFKFFNCYAALYYIAFFKAHSQLFGMDVECVGNDCMLDLGSQLGVFMICRLTLSNFLELGIPYILMKWRGRSALYNPLTLMPDVSNAEKQSKREDFDVYEDMDEVLILYGYTTLFVVACPWAPLVTLISVVLECFIDQKKLVLLYRRPFPLPGANNEPWDTAFDVFGFLAMITNTAVIVFSSHHYDSWSHGEKILLFMVIEHAMIFGRIVIEMIAPAIPREVKLLQMQQQVMVHRHLNLGGEEDDQGTRATAMMNTMAQAVPVYDHDRDEDQDF